MTNPDIPTKTSSLYYVQPTSRTSNPRNPKFFQVNDINTLIHNVTHTYLPEITEPVPQTNYIVQYDDPTTPPPQFSLHQIYMTNDDIPN